MQLMIEGDLRRAILPFTHSAIARYKNSFTATILLLTPRELDQHEQQHHVG
jgi:hypothetical protein